MPVDNEVSSPDAVSRWWRSLNMRERRLLREMLYDMSVSDFENFGITVDDNNRYIRSERGW